MTWPLEEFDFRGRSLNRKAIHLVAARLNLPRKMRGGHELNQTADELEVASLTAVDSNESLCRSGP